MVRGNRKERKLGTFRMKKGNEVLHMGCVSFGPELRGEASPVFQNPIC